jgi:hypothetical protein
MDSIFVLAIAKKQDACFKIGSGYFVDNEEDLEKAFTAHSAVKRQNQVTLHSEAKHQASLKAQKQTLMDMIMTQVSPATSDQTQALQDLLENELLKLKLAAASRKKTSGSTP